jgi:hypothetical protein
MLPDSGTALPSLPTATWLDEVLTTARESQRLVAIRFGRTADPCCQTVDGILREVVASPSVLGSEEAASMLSVFTVDIDEVPEFTYMYELYDPCSVMIFHRSKPLLIDAGHGPVRKLTEFAQHHGPSLAVLLAAATRTVLEHLSSSQQGSGPPVVVVRVNDGGARKTDDAPDDAPTWKETGVELASVATGRLSAKAEQWRLRETAAKAQEKAEAALQVAKEKSAVALESARGRTLAFVQDALAAKPAPGTGTQTTPSDEPASGASVGAATAPDAAAAGVADGAAAAAAAAAPAACGASQTSRAGPG